MCSPRGSKSRLPHRVEDSGKRAWKSSVLRGSSSERKVIRAVEDYPETCADVKVDVEAVDRLIEPEEVEVCLRYTLKYSTRRGSSIFLFFDTEEKKEHFVASRRCWFEHHGGRVTI